MKKLMVALLFLVAMSSIASAQGDPFIGMYADDAAVLCSMDVTVYTTATVYFFAVLPDGFGSVTAAEFSVGNLPDASMALITPNWNTDLVIGTLGYGIALAFAPAIPGPNALLGTVDFFPLVDFGQDYRIEVLPSQDSGGCTVVNEAFEEIPCELQHWFTFNCAGGLPYGCECTVTIATEDAAWGQIKALY
jgi:hypothetical protein